MIPEGERLGHGKHGRRGQENAREITARAFFSEHLLAEFKGLLFNCVGWLENISCWVFVGAVGFLAYKGLWVAQNHPIAPPSSGQQLPHGRAGWDSIASVEGGQKN